MTVLMTAPANEAGTVEALMAAIGVRARAAQRRLAMASGEDRTAALVAMAGAVRARSARILAVNAEEMEALARSDRPASFAERARLDPKRIEAMAEGLLAVAALPDPVGRVLASWTRPNGLAIERVAVPLGVVGVIYEARPNVTADAAALCVKAGNAVVLRAGSETARTAAAIGEALREGLAAAGLPADAVEVVPTADRAAVGEMLKGLSGNLDVIVPRGGRSLVERVEAEARVPVFAHLDGICHTYVHGSADREMAVAVVLNAKMRRPGICGATETLLVDAAVAESHLPAIAARLSAAGCALRGDAAARRIVPGMDAATEEDWRTEYLDAILSVRVVAGLDEAIDHVNRYGSHHTDSILATDDAAAERFLAEVDSAIVMHNASTQFADGGEFGMGAEIGIATGRLHARGPVGVEQLTTFNYRVRGAGQTRP